MADPGFPVGGRRPRRGGRGPPRQLRFENFACQNERIWTRRGGARRVRPPRSANTQGQGLSPTYVLAAKGAEVTTEKKFYK